MEEKPGSRREYSVTLVRNLGTKISKIISQLQILIQSPLFRGENKAIMIQGILEGILEEAEREGLGIIGVARVYSLVFRRVDRKCPAQDQVPCALYPALRQILVLYVPIILVRVS